MAVRVFHSCDWHDDLSDPGEPIPVHLGFRKVPKVVDLCEAAQKEITYAELIDLATQVGRPIPDAETPTPRKRGPYKPKKSAEPAPSAEDDPGMAMGPVEVPDEQGLFHCPHLVNGKPCDFEPRPRASSIGTHRARTHGWVSPQGKRGRELLGTA